MERRLYYIFPIIVNGQKINRVIIDPHYEVKHKDSVNDQTILNLVKFLENRQFRPAKESMIEPFYYVDDKIELAGKKYKLIWILNIKESYIGIVNCYRRD